MRQAFKLLTAATLFWGLVISQTAEAAFFSFPRLMPTHALHIQMSSPALPPFAHSKFCVQYPSDCEVHRIAFRGGKAKMTPQRWLDLVAINNEVNKSIVFQRNEGGVATEEWLISPARGDCNDYAVTKRHELLVRGWPSRALLLAEVVTSWGEHHLVLLVRTEQGDFVADSLSHKVRPWAEAPYQWVRMQTPKNPRYWAAIGGAAV
jgi:predicted transglutaminase-like cysteine proteinase